MSCQRDKLDADLAALATMSPARLRQRWAELSKKPLPRLSPATLRLALAYELQANVLGDLSGAAQQRLDQAAAAKTQTRSASPCMRLVREWQGKVHFVTIGENGEVEWNGRIPANRARRVSNRTSTHSTPSVRPVRPTS